MKHTAKLGLLVVFCSLVILVFSSGGAFALDIPGLPDGETIYSIFNPMSGNNKTDETIGWLISAFGPFVGPDSGQENWPLAGHALALFNASMLGVASILLAYKLIVGVVQTAHDGEMLGKRWSTLWGPLRVALAAFALAPMKYGLCIVQLMILYLAAMGVGLANHLWSQSIKGLTEMGSPITYSIPEDFESTGQSLFQIEVCRELVQHFYEDFQNSQSGIANAPGKRDYVIQETEFIPNGAQGENVLVNFVATAPMFDSTGSNDLVVNSSDPLCGQLSYRRGEATAEGHPGTGTSFATEIENIGNGTQKAIDEAMLSSHVTSVAAFRNAIRPLARQIVRSSYPSATIPQEDSIDANVIAEAIYAYGASQSIKGAKVFRAANADYAEALQTTATGTGWGHAGAWWMELSRYADNVNEVTRSHPTVTGPEWEDVNRFLGGSTGGELRLQRLANVDNGLIESADNIFAGAGAVWQAGVARGRVMTPTGEPLGYNMAATSTSSASPKGVIGTVLAMFSGSPKAVPTNGNGGKEIETLETPFSGTISGFLLPFDEIEDGANPMTVLSGYGRGLIDFLIGVVAFGAGIQIAAAGFKGGVSGLWNVVTFGVLGGTAVAVVKAASIAFGLVIAVATVAVIPAIFLGLILPIMPFMLWSFALMGWFILVIEAVVAGPLWALAHMRMDGEGLAGPEGGAGYKIILSMLLRPALMILGLLLGFVAFTVMAPFVGRSFQMATAVTFADNGGLGLVSWIVSIIMMTVIYVWLANKCFSLTHAIPDRILRWIGGGSEMLGEEESMGQTRAMTMMAMTQASGMAFGAIDRRRMASRDKAQKKSMDTLNASIKEGIGGGGGGDDSSNAKSTKGAGGAGGAAGAVAGAVSSAFNQSSGAAGDAASKADSTNQSATKPADGGGDGEE